MLIHTYGIYVSASGPADKVTCPCLLVAFARRARQERPDQSACGCTQPLCNHYVYFPNLNPLPSPLLQLVPSQRLALAQRRGYSHPSLCLTEQRTIAASSPWHDARHGCSSDADGHRARSSQAPFPSPPHFRLFFTTTFFSATPPLQLPFHLCPICNGQTHSASRQRTAARHHH